MNILSYILWNPSLEAFSIGPFSIRWYSLMWLIGLALAYLMVRWLYKKQGIPNEKFEPLFIYCFMGILIGARLGHCIFYQPDYFLTSWKGVIEMFLPIHIDAAGGWKMTGYQGLASHGGTLGLIITLLLYVRRFKVPAWVVLDNIAIATGITACCIRIGNLMTERRSPAGGSSPSWSALRGYRLCPTLRADVLALQEDAATRRHRLLFRPLPGLYLHLPLLHRVLQGGAGSLRAGPSLRYGTDTLYSLYCNRRLLHDKIQKQSFSLIS